MRTTRIAVVGGLVMTLAGMAFGQMNGNPNPVPSSTGSQMSMQSPRVSVQRGPYIGFSRYASADVFVNGRFALRVPRAAGGLTPMRRARIVADRMRSAFAAGYTWNDMKVQQVNGLWTVAIGDRSIVTADRRSARAMGLSTGFLASRWARQSVVALGGQPTMVAQAIGPFPEQMVAGSRQELGRLNWAVSPTKSVPMLDAATSSQSGNITVAGSKGLLAKVNSVVVFTTAIDGATAYTFVPVTDTAVGTSMTRVNGVGVVNVSPDNMPSMAGGSDFAGTISRMSTRWNAAINSNLIQQRLQVLGNTKIVPLYASDSGKVVGAVQIVGRPNAVTEVRSVALSASGNTHGFSAMSTRPGTAMSAGNPLTDVVVSAVILPAGTASGTVPSATTPSTAPSMSTPATPGSAQPGSGGTCGSSDTPPAPPLPSE